MRKFGDLFLRGTDDLMWIIFSSNTGYKHSPEVGYTRKHMQTKHNTMVLF